MSYCTLLKERLGQEGGGGAEVVLGVSGGGGGPGHEDWVKQVAGVVCGGAGGQGW